MLVRISVLYTLTSVNKKYMVNENVYDLLCGTRYLILLQFTNGAVCKMAASFQNEKGFLGTKLPVE